MEPDVLTYHGVLWCLLSEIISQIVCPESKRAVQIHLIIDQFETSATPHSFPNNTPSGIYVFEAWI